jgi:hypothetical protein
VYEKIKSPFRWLFFWLKSILLPSGKIKIITKIKVFNSPLARSSGAIY